METRSNHVLVGAIVLALLFGLAFFIVWLGQLAGEDQKRYDIFFQQSVEGLAKGSSVTFRGVPVGQIETIRVEPANPQFIRVRIGVRGDTPVLLGTTATIRGVGFTGVSQIELDPPEPGPGQPPLARREEISCPAQNPETECPYGVPVIPTRPGALGQLLNTAPELLERVSTLTERLTELLGDRNQESIAAILDHMQEISRSLAERSPEIAATLAEARVAIRQAGDAAERMGALAGTNETLLDRDGRPLINDLRHTIRSAERSMENLEAVLADARPGVQAFTTTTLPEVGRLIHDMRETSQSLRAVTERLEERGIGGLIGGERLPDYRPERRRR